MLYKKTALNILEASFYHVKLYSGNQLALTYIYTGFAFLELAGILLFHLWCRLKSSSVMLKAFCQFFFLIIDIHARYPNGRR